MTNTTATKFMRLTRTRGYAKVDFRYNEDEAIRLAQSVAPLGWIADTGANWCEHNDCWIVDFEVAPAIEVKS